MKHTIQFAPTKCMGCHSCELACSFRHEGTFNPAYSRIFVKIDGSFHSPLTCLQCEEPWCASVCPKKAILRNPATGVLQVDQKLCVGCRMCTLECPFGLIVMGPRKRAIKCDLCGGDPECVKACTYGAIQYSVEDESARQKRDKIFYHVKRSIESLVPQKKEFKFPELKHS